MKITGVKAYLIRPAKQQSWLSSTVIANPMSIYPKFYAQRSSWNGSGQAAVVVEITTDDGVVGWGQGGGGPLAKEAIENHLSKFLIGEDPFNVELLWDQMYRGSLPYGEKGVVIHAISGVDLALWDVIGRAKGEPVWRLIGGKTKERIPAYATGNETQSYKARGFTKNKLAMPHGPYDGWEGMKKNVELIAKTRDILGPDGDIMLDCYMAWDVEYSLRMAELIEPYRVRWIEEVLPPEDFDGFAELRQKVRGTAIATGEHVYTRWGQLELLRRRAVDILQPDIHWVGGITEMKKVIAMASAFRIPVIPHAGGLSAGGLAVIASSINCPMAEVVVVDDPSERNELWFGLPRPENGFIVPPEGPGLGVEVNRDLLIG
jgi:L-rhamnonate dehydratase